MTGTGIDELKPLAGPPHTRDAAALAQPTARQAGYRAQPLKAIGKEAHRNESAWVDVAGGQHAPPPQVRQPERVGFVVALLEPAVGLPFGCVDQLHRIAVVMERVHQPIAVEGGLHRQALD